MLKIASWPLGFILLAAGAGRTYVVAEWSAAIVFAAATGILLPLLGIAATGVAFLTMYGVYLVLVYTLARRRTGFRWRRSVLALAFVVFLFAVFISIVSSRWPLTSLFFGLAISAGTGVFALQRLSSKNALPRRAMRVLSKIGIVKSESQNG